MSGVYDEFAVLVKENKLPQAFDIVWNSGYTAGKRDEHDPAYRQGYQTGFQKGFHSGFDSGFNTEWIKAHSGQPFAMFDSTDASSINPNPPAVAGYIDGHWPSFSALVQRFPNAKHLSIAVFAQDNAECCDVENQDLTPDQVPDWVKRQHARGLRRPVVYCSLSVVPAVAQALHDAGISRSQVRLWVAHYTGSPHICTDIGTVWGSVNADATQWTDHGPNGENFDQSLCTPGFL